MNMHEFLLFLVAFTIPYIIFLIMFYELNKILNKLSNFILAQKDITAFKYSFDGKKESTLKIDAKKEKENQDMIDYTTIINSGICDDKDVKRFGTVTVDQG